MRRALTLAERGWGQVAPNPLVGAVVVRNGTVVGEGWHRRFGGPHAEVMAISAAGHAARDATLYVTLEPCNHTGKTPPCTEAIMQAGITRVVYALGDPNAVAAGGAERLRKAGVSVREGVLADASAELIAPFVFAAHQTAANHGPRRPWVTLKLAVSLDGALADHTREPGWITGRRARAAVQHLRAGADAVAVGIGTALADDPLLTARLRAAPRTPPVRVVFDRNARLPLASQLVRTVDAAPVLVVASRTPRDEADSERRLLLRAAGVTVLEANVLDEALEQLHRRGVQHLLVEGGAGLASSLVGTNVVDRLIIIQGAVILGSGALPAFAALPPRTVAEGIRWRVVARRALGDDSMTTYAVCET